MDKIFDFIERHKYGILATLVVHIGIFVYFQVATYKEVVLFEPWEFRSAKDEKPDDIEISPEQIQTPQERELFTPLEEVTSFVRDENDTRDRSQKENINYTSSYQKSSAEQMERDYEQSVKDQIQRQREEKDGPKSSTSSEVKTNKNNKKPPSKNTTPSSSSSTEAIGGKTMVSFTLANRHPLNHNDWNIRNPGYTCGNVNGLVTVAISVDVGGDVVSATIVEGQSQGATACMLQRAKEYALKSRFNYAGSGPKKQDGFITYRFVYRE